MVIALVGSCAQNKDIAFEMHIAEGTVKRHVRNIYREMNYYGAGSRTRLAIWAHDNAGLLTPPKAA
jgi:DNA-binding NarL/FixJ family response regulator